MSETNMEYYWTKNNKSDMFGIAYAKYRGDSSVMCNVILVDDENNKIDRGDYWLPYNDIISDATYDEWVAVTYLYALRDKQQVADYIRTAISFTKK